jgi:hypothetical protein
MPSPGAPIVREECTAGKRTTAVRQGLARRLFLPSISDVLFVAFVALFFIAGGGGWSQLLLDGDTGTHIRTGEFILSTHTVPHQDLYSFTSPEKPWYAWEWLAAAMFGAAHQIAGLKGVVLLAGTVICLALMLLFRQMIWRGVALPAAVAVIIVAAGAMNFHFLARPHIFTTLLTVVAFWMLERDLAEPARAIWLLPFLTVVWTNLHGGFPVVIVALGLAACAALLRREPSRFRRYAVLAALCAAATMLNPYGWKLHTHLAEYLRSDWLVNRIDEFQSPVFRGGSMLRFEILLFAGLIVVFELVRKRRYYEAMLIVFWAHASLVSARHATIYAIAASPAIAEQLTALWDRWTGAAGPSSVRGVLRDVFRDMQRQAARTSIWIPVFVVLLAAGRWAGPWPADFPPAFPTELLSRNASLVANGNARILSSDWWGGYLNYRFYPQRRVFIDGRSDFYGPGRIDEYMSLRMARDSWEDLADRYGFDFALIPPDWPLSQALKTSRRWKMADQDRVAILFRRVRVSE